MSDKHTPGPWHATPWPKSPNVDIHNNDGPTPKFIAELRPSQVEGEEMMANARLIAAAPELLSALNLVLNDNRLMNAMNKIQARAILDAVAKATGGGSPK